MTQGERAPRAVVCEDDNLTGSVVARLLTESGYDVAAETDNPAYALSVIEQFGVDVAVVDISLDKGDGEDVIRVVRDRQLPCRIVVFSAFADDPLTLLAMGADAVIDKPDFERLETVLCDYATAVRDPSFVERRRSIPPRDDSTEPATAEQEAHGFAASELARRAAGLRAGDAVIAFAVDDEIDLRDVVDGVARDGDRLYRTEEGDVVLLLLDPTVETLGAVHRRVAAALADKGASEPVTVGALCRSDEATRHTLARVLGELHGARPGLTYV
jgi:CheY-like chemotaxis protein